MKQKRLILLLLLLFTVIFIKLNYGDKSFNKKEWANNPRYRYRMTNDLIQSQKLIGKTKHETVELLTNDCKHFDMESDTWMYYTKIERGWRDANIEILDIIFNSDIVTRAEIRE